MSSKSLYTRLVSSLLFPLHERLKQHDSVALRRRMEDSQWWPAERLQALRVERLRALLTDIGQHVPYYRELFAAHAFDPCRVAALEDLRALPFLTKALIRAHTGEMKHPGARGLARFNTGGSSGEPLIFFIGTERVTHDVAAKCALRAGGTSTLAIARSWCGARRSNSARKTACAWCATP